MEAFTWTQIKSLFQRKGKKPFLGLEPFYPVKKNAKEDINLPQILIKRMRVP